MRLVQKLMDEGRELNVTGNGGVHFNGVKIVEIYEDFIAVEPGSTAVRGQGQFRGEQVFVNIATITRLEFADLQNRVRGNLLGHRGV